MARLDDVEQRRRADARHQNENVELMKDELGAESIDGFVLLEREGDLSEGWNDERQAAMTLDQPAHLLRHAAFERKDAKPLEVAP